MSKYVLIRNGMTNAEEEDILHFPNEFIYQEGVLDTDSMAVTQRGAGANMSVDVSGGRAYVKNDSWATNSATETKYWPVLNTATTNVTITSNSSGNPRIDIIVCKVDSAITPDADASNIMTIYAVAGTPAASPSAPATPTNSFKLAEIAVASGATSIVTANITDSRTFANLYVPDGNPIFFDPPSDVGTLMYGGTEQTGTPTSGDGWRMVYDQSYNGGSADFLVWEKTDGNQTSPDGGFAWLMTGNDGVQEETLVITGAGTVEVHDGNAFRVYDSADTEYFQGLWSGSNFQLIITTGNLHVYDTDHDVALSVYGQAGGTSYIYLQFTGGVGVMATGTGDIHVTPAGGDFVLMDGTTLTLMNPASSANTQFYVDTNNDTWCDVPANGDVFIISSFIRRNHSSTAYENSFEQEGWGYINGDGTRAVTAGFTLGKGYSSSAWILTVSGAGEKGSVPSTSNDGTATGVCAFLGIPTAATTFNVTYFKTDAAGTTTAGTYGIFHFFARGPI